MTNKLKSRKFWVSIAAFLGSIGASIAGLMTNEKWITVTGTVCAMLSMAIYAAVEAYTDANCQRLDDNVILTKTKFKDVDGSVTESTFVPKDKQ